MNKFSQFNLLSINKITKLCIVLIIITGINCRNLQQRRVLEEPSQEVLNLNNSETVNKEEEEPTE